MVDKRAHTHTYSEDMDGTSWTAATCA